MNRVRGLDRQPRHRPVHGPHPLEERRRLHRVDLLKSTPGGFEQVGTLAQSVPVRPPGGTATKFAFSYTVTQTDQSIGKVTFKAAATLLDHRDALPGDNELNSPPVKIT
ncbi:MAG TPA: hypothetical protein VFD04_05280 [Actinomycetes bacterium]|nr:hypothetical protein [Actinomycetes bacterium]